MKDFKYYEEKARKEIMDLIKQGPVRLAVDLLIENPKDLEKTSVQHAIKRITKKNARSEMQKDQKPGLRMIIPVPGSKLNEIRLDEGIPLPAYAPMILETHEITEDQMIIGLFLMLQKAYDFYYLKLLKSFELDESILVPELIEMRTEKLKYWKRRKISTKPVK